MKQLIIIPNKMVGNHKETKAQKKSIWAETNHGTEQKLNDLGLCFSRLTMYQNYLEGL